MKSDIKILFSGLIVSVLFVAFTLYSCEAAIINCFKSLKPPELPSKELKTGYLRQPYLDELIPYIPESPNNNGYRWDFNVKGQLPEGIEVYLGVGRIVVEGIPEQLGVFEFEVFLDLDPIDGTNICDFNGASKEYVIQIKQ